MLMLQLDVILHAYLFDALCSVLCSRLDLLSNLFSVASACYIFPFSMKFLKILEYCINDYYLGNCVLRALVERAYMAVHLKMKTLSVSLYFLSYNLFTGAIFILLLTNK